MSGTNAPGEAHSDPSLSSNPEPDSITLPDGRSLSFARFGASNGYPIFYLHGHPGSRLEAAVFAAAASRLGATIFGIDRPGAGHSSPHPGRKVLDHAHDVQNLAKQLGIERYKVLGVSGGGPYALGCAFAHAESSLEGVALVAGMGAPDAPTKTMHLAARLLWTATAYTPGLLRWGVNTIVSRQLAMSNEDLVKASQKSLTGGWRKIAPREQEALADGSFMRMMFPSLREHFRQSYDGYVEECQVLKGDLGFQLQDIKFSPVTLWYGKQDDQVPVEVGKDIAEKLGARPEFKTVDETHMSIIVNWRDQILQDLLENKA